MVIVTLVSLLILVCGCPTANTVQGQSPNPVRVEITVTDARQSRRYVTALSKDQITVLDEKVPQEITFFGQSDQPMSIGLVFDTSRAHYISRDNYAKLLASTKEAFLNFIRASEKDNQHFILGFDGDVHLAADWVKSSGQVADGFDKLAAIKPAKKTAFYDAVHAALLKINSGVNQKRVIILVSDGRDHGSKLKWDGLLDAVRRSNALVYAISVVSPDSGPSSRGALDKLCSVSGGIASYPRTGDEFYEDFERLSVELKHQYTISFIPRGVSCNGVWRRLSYKGKTIDFKGLPSVSDRGDLPLAVRGREGYYCGP